MAGKEFKTIEEQIEILKARGLSFSDEQRAKVFLLHNNYYRISGYSLTLRKNDVFNKGTTFQNITDIYNFDYELRHILLKYIEEIEVHFKSVFVYEFSRVYGPTGYLNVNNFENERKYNEIIDKTNEQKRKSLQHEAYLKHFVNALKQNIPFWAYVDLFTISDISFLYSISKHPIKSAVAKRFGLVINKGPDILGGYMHSLTIVRNLCAHGSRLFNRLFEHKPSLNKNEQELLLKKSDGQIDNMHLFGFVLIMKRLLFPERFATMKQDIMMIMQQYPFVKMRYYGFRDDWVNLV